MTQTVPRGRFVWHELMTTAIENGLHATPWRDQAPGADENRPFLEVVPVSPRFTGPGSCDVERAHGNILSADGLNGVVFPNGKRRLRYVPLDRCGR